MPLMISRSLLSTSSRSQLYRMEFWAISRADTATPPEPEALAPAVKILGLSRRSFSASAVAGILAPST